MLSVMPPCACSPVSLSSEALTLAIGVAYVFLPVVLAREGMVMLKGVWLSKKTVEASASACVSMPRNHHNRDVALDLR